jgi:hypothetical protein
MAKNPPQQAEAEYDFKTKYLRKGKHLTLLHLPNIYHADIGLVIAYWGHLEMALNQALKGLIDAEAADNVARDTAGWQRLPFRKRKRLFKAICREWVSTWNAPVAAELGKIADKASSLARKRNMIAHGTYAFTLLAHSSTAEKCRAINYETGEEMFFDSDVLQRLWHDISHLTADLILEMSKIAEIQGLFHALPDTEILRIYRETNHPWNPNPNKRTPPPEPSQA